MNMKNIFNSTRLQRLSAALLLAEAASTAGTALLTSIKKTILATTILIAGSFGIMAQGFVNFSNDPHEAWPEPTPPDRLIYVGSIAPGNAVSDPTWTAALFENRGGTWTKLGDSVSFWTAIFGLEGIWVTVVYRG